MPVPPFIHVPPTVITSERVLHAIVADTQRHMATETGETLVGLVVEPSPLDFFREPVIYVLGTIPAGDAVIRQSALFALGGEFQVRVFKWLQQNWEAMREQSRSMESYNTLKWGNSIPVGVIPAAFDLPLRDIGDWHRHPDGLKFPSGGDLNTAIETLNDPELPTTFLLAPIVTVAHHTPTSKVWRGDLLGLNTPDMEVEISFSYLSDLMIGKGLRDFITIRPEIVSDNLLPQLPLLAWDLADESRFLLELKLLRDDYGCTVNTYYRETRDGPPLEVCFEIIRTNCSRPWDYSLFIETSATYPKDPPAVRIVKSGQPAPTPQVSEKEQERPRGIQGWFQRKVERFPLLKLPQLNQQTEGSFVWEASISTLLSLVIYLEERGKVWKPLSGTVSHDTSVT